MASNLGSVALTSIDGATVSKTVLLNTTNAISMVASGSGASIQYQFMQPDQKRTLISSSSPATIQTEFNTVDAGVKHSMVPLTVINQIDATTSTQYLDTDMITWVEEWPNDATKSALYLADVINKQVNCLKINATVAAIKSAVNA